MDLLNKEVYFDQYCKTCKYTKKLETDQPCSECVSYPMNENSHKPRKYEERNGK